MRLTILFPRQVHRLMAGTHHIIMIIIQELTLSVCDLSLTPVQYHHHPAPISLSDLVAWHLCIFSALFNGDSETADKQRYRRGLQESACVFLSVNIHTLCYMQACLARVLSEATVLRGT